MRGASDPLGVGAVVLSSDHHLVLLRRGAHVAEYAGVLDLPGGHS